MSSTALTQAVTSLDNQGNVIYKDEDNLEPKHTKPAVKVLKPALKEAKPSAASSDDHTPVKLVGSQSQLKVGWTDWRIVKDKHTEVHNILQKLKPDIEMLTQRRWPNSKALFFRKKTRARYQ